MLQQHLLRSDKPFLPRCIEGRPEFSPKDVRIGPMAEEDLDTLRVVTRRCLERSTVLADSGRIHICAVIDYKLDDATLFVPGRAARSTASGLQRSTIFPTLLVYICAAYY